MSFRARLTLFFVVIVIVPIAAVGVVVFQLLADNEAGKANAQLAEEQRTAAALYQTLTAQARGAAAALRADPELTTAARAATPAVAARRARTLLRHHHLARLRLEPVGRPPVDVGDRTAVAPARNELSTPTGDRLGRLEVSDATAGRYVSRLAGLGVIADVRDPAGPTAGAGASSPPTAGDAHRSASFLAPAFDGRLRVTVLPRATPRSSDATADRVVVGAVLAAFLVFACLFALAVSRALQAQIGRLAAAARRLAAGDFSTPAPTEGRDEFAALGREFNTMSTELEHRLEELRRQRTRLERSIRRIGETFGAGLDGGALLELGARAALEAVLADGGRVCVRDERSGALTELLRLGAVDGLEVAVRDAEADALASGRLGAATVAHAGALAAPLAGSARGGNPRGLLSVARAGRPFTDSERELFGYLASQAAVSLDNVALHEQVQREAITDELTGLFNHRRFQEVVDHEVERARRFGHDLGLILLDIDDFKRVNDTYGHQQGDVVLRRVAALLRQSLREIDEPARYGGEEMAVALPQTDLAGAYRVAERARRAIETTDVERVDGRGTLRVTASVGVAALPDSAQSKEALVAAADAALYEAKRAGKNRTVRAAPTAAGAGGRNH